MGNLPGPLPPHLESECGNALCKTCEAPVKKKADTGRWYITVGHCGFNSPANNKAGYKDRRSALGAYARYRGLKYADSKSLAQSRGEVGAALVKTEQIRNAIVRGLTLAQTNGYVPSHTDALQLAGSVIQALRHAGYDIVRSRRIS